MDLMGMDDVFKDNDKHMQTSDPFYTGKSARLDLVIKDILSSLQLKINMASRKS